MNCQPNTTCQVRIFAALFLIMTIAQLSPIAVAQAFRAGLDFKFEVIENGECDTVTRDFGSYVFGDSSTYFQTQAVNKKDQFIELMFMRISDHKSSLPPINYDTLISRKTTYKAGFYRILRLKQGQTVELKRTNIKVKLIEVIGEGGGCYEPRRKE